MITSGILYALNLAGTLWLESRLTQYYRLEFFMLGIMFLATIILLSAEFQNFRWTHRGAIVFFALTLLNTGLMFIATGHFLAFSLTTMVGLAGLLRSVSKLDDSEEEKISDKPFALETYGGKNRERKEEDSLYVEPVTWVDHDKMESEVSSVGAKSVKKRRGRPPKNK